MIIRAIVHYPYGDTVRAYEGQTATEISAMLRDEDVPFEEITEEQYAAFVAALIPRR